MGLLLKPYFGAQGSVKDSIKNIAEFRERQEGLRDLFEAYEQSLKTVLDKDPDQQFILLTLKFGQQRVRADLRLTVEKRER